MIYGDTTCPWEIPIVKTHLNTELRQTGWRMMRLTTKAGYLEGSRITTRTKDIQPRMTRNRQQGH